MGGVCCRPLAVLQPIQPQLTLLLVGLDNGGKTTLVNALKGDLHGDTTATFGFSTHSFTTAASARLQVYDLGGGRGIRRIWHTYVAEVHGVIFVLDAADAGRFPEARAALQTLLQRPQLAGKPLLVFANKQDRPDAASCSAVADALQLKLQLQPLDGQQAQQTHQLQPLHTIVPCTAKAAPEQQQADPALQQGLEWLVSSIRPLYSQLQDKIDMEAAQARVQEQQRRQEREQRAAANKAQREREEQEAAAAAPVPPAAAEPVPEAVLVEQQQQCHQRKAADAPVELAVPVADGTQAQTITAADPVESVIVHHKSLPPAVATDASLHSPAPPASDGSPDKVSSPVATARSSSQRGLLDAAAGAAVAASTAADAAVLPAAAAGTGSRHLQAGPLGLLSMLLPGAAASSSLEFSDLKREAHEQLGPTPRAHSITSEASSVYPEPAAAHQHWKQPKGAGPMALMLWHNQEVTNKQTGSSRSSGVAAGRKRLAAGAHGQ